MNKPISTLRELLALNHATELKSNSEMRIWKCPQMHSILLMILYSVNSPVFMRISKNVGSFAFEIDLVLQICCLLF